MFRTIQRRLIALVVVGVFAIAVAGGALLSPHSAEAHYERPLACPIAWSSYDYAGAQWVAAPTGSDLYWYWKDWWLYWGDYISSYC